MAKSSPTLYLIAGPTAVGKTSLSFEIAKYLKTSIISADSRQFYKEITIGTAKPSKKELKAIKHYFINNKSIEELYSAGEYEIDVLKHLEAQFKTNKNALIVGGSGMYIDAVCKGLDNIPRDLKIREKLNKELDEFGIDNLKKQLRDLDPVQYDNMDTNNSQRVIRALEVCKIIKAPYSSLLKENKKNRDFKIVKILLYMNKEELKNRIDKRVDKMISDGLLKEAKNLIKFRNNNALNTVGYKEIFEYLDGESTKEEAISKIKINTRKYAKRQMTWFKRDNDFIWVDNIDSKKAIEIIKSIVNKN